MSAANQRLRGWLRFLAATSLLLGLLSLVAASAGLMAIACTALPAMALAGVAIVQCQKWGRDLIITLPATAGILLAVLSPFVMPMYGRSTLRSEIMKQVISADQVCKAIKLWAQENDGALPPDLDALVREDLLPEEFVNGSTGRGKLDHVPMELLLEGHLDDYSPDTPMIRSTRPVQGSFSEEPVWLVGYVGGQIKLERMRDDLQIPQPESGDPAASASAPPPAQ